jgi:hypothetical protein
MTQIFKSQIPTNVLFKLLDNVCTKNNSDYIFDKNSYKKGIFNESIPIFLAECKQYYFLSKQKYLERKLSFNNFTTVLRQICNFCNIKYTSDIKYDKSTYNIVYTIYDNSEKISNI